MSLTSFFYDIRNKSSLENPYTVGSTLMSNPLEKIHGTANILMLVYSYLIDAAQEQLRSTSLAALSLDSNALKQRNLILESCTYCKLQKVPDQIKEYNDVVQKEITKNTAVINNVMSENKNIAMRQDKLSGQMSILQQNSQIQQTNTNSTVNFISMLLQQGSFLMRTIKDLSFNACIKKGINDL